MKIEALIIDDENKARALLNTILKECCPEITEVYEAKDLLEGVSLIKQYNPGIVFLDIEMPKYSGLKILEFVDRKDFNFEIVFTTAYSKYAIEAFQLSAVDYLLKPIHWKQVQEAVQKATILLEKNQTYERLLGLSHVLSNPSSYHKIALPVSDGVRFLELNDIICFEADGMYTKVYILNDEDILISKPLKHFENLLRKTSTFFRPHRSYLINITHVKKYINKEGNYIQMDNGVTFSISRQKKDEFISFMNVFQRSN